MEVSGRSAGEPPHDARCLALKSLPETIRIIIEQAGGFRLASAFAYIGANRFVYRCPCPAGKCRPEHPSRLNTEDRCSFVDVKAGIRCPVNGELGRNRTLIVAYEPDDTYTVWLVKGHDQRTADTMVLPREREVYCDALRVTIECAFDRATQNYNGGLISLG